MLRLDKFKKVAEDDNVVTMRHDDGHEMKIFLNGLKSKLQREQLKRLKLSDGGSVKGVHKSESDEDDVDYGRPGESKVGSDIRSNYTPSGKYQLDSSHKSENNKVVERSKGKHHKVLGEIVSMKNRDRKYLADGGDPGPDGDYMTNSTPFYDGSKEKWTQYPQEQNRAPASDSKPDDSQDQSSPDSGHTTNVIINPTPAQQPQAQTAPPQANDTQPQGGQPQSAAAQYGQQPVSVQQPDINASASKNISSEGNVNPYGVERNAQLGSENQRNINISQGQAQAQVQQGYNDAVAQTAQRDQDNFNKYILGPTEQFKQYMNQNPINPKAYQENMSTGQKVSTAIGLFLGGFKQGLVGGNNPAMDFLNHQIDRDINGQKARADQQRTVWGAYRDLYGDSNVTNSLAKVSMLDLYNNKMKQVALQLNTPQAWANYQLGSSDIAIKKQQEMKNAMTDLSASPGWNGAIAPGQSDNGKSSFQKKQNLYAPPKSLNPQDRLLTEDAPITWNKFPYKNYGAPLEDKKLVQDQYYKAIQGEYLLSNVDDIFNKMIHAARAGGRDDYNRRHLTTTGAQAAGGVGGSIVGSLLGAGAGAMAGAPINGGAIGATTGGGIGAAAGSLKDIALGPISSNNKIYQANLARLQSEARGALPNSAYAELDSILDSTAAEYNDGPKDLAAKKDAFKKFIKANIEHGALAQYGMWKQ